MVLCDRRNLHEAKICIANTTSAYKEKMADLLDHSWLADKSDRKNLKLMAAKISRVQSACDAFAPALRPLSDVDD